MQNKTDTLIASKIRIKASIYDDIIRIAHSDVSAEGLKTFILAMAVAMESVEGANELGK